MIHHMGDESGSRSHVLSVVVCGAAPASSAGTLVREAVSRGWAVQVIATPSALPFLDLESLGTLSGRLVRSQYSKPGDPRSLLPELHALLERAAIQSDESTVEELAPATRLLGAREAKGLEFDHVVVVEPAAIADDGDRGLRELYVALTRPTKTLVVVHARPLPDGLAVPAGA